MNDENSKKLWTYIQESGDKLVGKLPPSRHHPKGRNPYAHIAICVKKKFGKSYKKNLKILPLGSLNYKKREIFDIESLN